MKKVLLCVIGLSLAMTTLVSCGDSFPKTATKVPYESVLLTPAPSEPASLSVDDAIAVYNTWLGNHDEVASYTLESQYYQTFDMFGEPYYWFSANDPIRYWYHILVHMETGELLFMMKSDGEHSGTSIEPLDDWYNSIFAESSEPEDVPSTIASLSADDAIAVYNTWLGDHDEVSAYTLESQYYQTFDMFGEPYYWFSAEDSMQYWYHILVHMETGELLFMMISDGEHAATSIERLEDWYSNTYAVG